MMWYVIVAFVVGALLAALICYWVMKNLSKAEQAVLQTKLEASEQGAQKMVEVVKEQAKASEEQRAQQAENELKLVREQLKSQFEEQLKVREAEFKQANKEQMSGVVDPLQKELKELRELVDKTKENNDKATSQLHESIQNVLRHDQNRDKVTQDLAEALKNRGKVQGDWGEQVLTNILTDSGLREGKEYYTQYDVKNEDGRDLRPDVIVRAADGSAIIIDSKVSLTAYTDYVGAASEEERAKAIKENYDSIWKHVTELSDKNYKSVVKESVPIVLMFVPNEGSYILAMNKDPQLSQKAFRKGVLIINPTNLMLALDLILRTWQNSRQEENVLAIIKAAEGIYEKYALFAENYKKLGDRMEQAQKAYDEARKQLIDGNGNLSGKVQSLLKMGIKSGKSIPAELSSNDLDQIEA